MTKSKALDLFVEIMAVDRIARLVVEDEITRDIREWVDRKFPDSKISYGVNCKACVSVWAALLVNSGLMPRWVISSLAASASILLIDRQDDRVGAIVSTYRRRASGANAGGSTS